MKKAKELERGFAPVSLEDPEKAAAYLRLVIDTIPTLAWSADADGSAEFFNQRWLDYTGLSAEQAYGWGWKVALDTDDRDHVVDQWRKIVTRTAPAELEARLRRYDGVIGGFFSARLPRSTSVEESSNGSEQTSISRIENGQSRSAPL